jgi:hypothetical protein
MDLKKLIDRLLEKFLTEFCDNLNKRLLREMFWI